MPIDEELPRKKRYRKGARMQHVTEFVIVVLNRNHFYEGDKLQNAGWGQNWSIAYIAARISRGGLYFAIEDKTNG